MEQETLTNDQLQGQVHMLMKVNEKLKAELANLLGKVAELSVLVEVFQESSANETESAKEETE